MARRETHQLPLRLLTYQAVQQNLNTSGEHRDEARMAVLFRKSVTLGDGTVEATPIINSDKVKCWLIVLVNYVSNGSAC